MNLNRKNTQRLLLLLGPLVAASAIAVNPANAVSKASSEAKVELFDFSHNPLEVFAAIDSQTFTSATNGTATAIATPTAFFLNSSEPRAENSSLSQAQGDGTVYQGIAKSFAGVLGYNFEIAAEETFSFKFDTLLKLATFTDNPARESARASGNITFQLFDSSDQDNLVVLDEFSIFGALTTPGESDQLDMTTDSNFVFNSKTTSLTRSFGSNQEFATAKTQGIFSRFFAQKTKLTLIEQKENYAIVEAVPEPTSAAALLVTSASLWISGAMKRKKSLKNC